MGVSPNASPNLALNKKRISDESKLDIARQRMLLSAASPSGGLSRRRFVVKGTGESRRMVSAPSSSSPSPPPRKMVHPCRRKDSEGEGALRTSLTAPDRKSVKDVHNNNNNMMMLRSSQDSFSTALMSIPESKGGSGEFERPVLSRADKKFQSKEEDKPEDNNEEDHFQTPSEHHEEDEDDSPPPPPEENNHFESFRRPMLTRLDKKLVTSSGDLEEEEPPERFLRPSLTRQTGNTAATAAVCLLSATEHNQDHDFRRDSLQQQHGEMSFARWSEADHQPWTCGACTYVNEDILHLSCAVCGTSRSKAQRSNSDLVSLAETSVSAMSLPEELDNEEEDENAIRREQLDELINEQFELLKSYENDHLRGGHEEQDTTQHHPQQHDTVQYDHQPHDTAPCDHQPHDAVQLNHQPHDYQQHDGQPHDHQSYEYQQHGHHQPQDYQQHDAVQYDHQPHEAMPYNHQQEAVQYEHQQYDTIPQNHQHYDAAQYNHHQHHDAMPYNHHQQYDHHPQYDHHQHGATQYNHQQQQQQQQHPATYPTDPRQRLNELSQRFTSIMQMHAAEKEDQSAMVELQNQRRACIEEEEGQDTFVGLMDFNGDRRDSFKQSRQQQVSMRAMEWVGQQRMLNEWEQSIQERDERVERLRYEQQRVWGMYMQEE